MVFSVFLILIALFSLICTNIIFFSFRRAKFSDKNYSGKTVVKSLGVSLVIYFVFVYVFGVLFDQPRGLFDYLPIIALPLGLSGILDDFYGSDEYKGFKGHIKALARGKVTTGIIKAATGFLTGALVAFLIGGPIAIIVLKTLVFALAVNFFNLLDLRPGRALKAYLLVVFIFTLFIKSPYNKISIVAILPTFSLLYFDLYQKAMLGDAGSNILGGIIGFLIIAFLPNSLVYIAFVLFILLNLAAEKWSFTEIIENNSFLKWFDNLGRLN